MEWRRLELIYGTTLVCLDSTKDHIRALNVGTDDLQKEWRWTRKRSGDDCAVVLNEGGWVLLSITLNNWIWGCGLPGTELRIMTGGNKLRKWQRSSRGIIRLLCNNVIVTVIIIAVSSRAVAFLAITTMNSSWLLSANGQSERSSWSS